MFMRLIVCRQVRVRVRTTHAYMHFHEDRCIHVLSCDVKMNTVHEKQGQYDALASVAGDLRLKLGAAKEQALEADRNLEYLKGRQVCGLPARERRSLCA